MHIIRATLLSATVALHHGAVGAGEYALETRNVPPALRDVAWPGGAEPAGLAPGAAPSHQQALLQEQALLQQLQQQQRLQPGQQQAWPSQVEPHRPVEMQIPSRYPQPFRALPSYQQQLQAEQDMGFATSQQLAQPRLTQEFDNSAFLQTYAQAKARLSEQIQAAAPPMQDASQTLLQMQQQQQQPQQQPHMQDQHQGQPQQPVLLEQRLAEMRSELGATQQRSEQLRTENSQLRQELDRWRVTAEHVAQREAWASTLLERPAVAQALQAAAQKADDGKPAVVAPVAPEASPLKLLATSAEGAVVHSIEEFGKGHWGPPGVIQLAFFVVVAAAFIAVALFRWAVEKKNG